MTDVPKIVHSRLRPTPERGSLQETHPEADVLTAFTEQALSAAERDHVLQHLALCADCRDVVALALPALDAAVPPLETETETVRTVLPNESHATWLGWAGLRWERLGWAHLSWAALAAGIAVAVLVVGPGLERRAKVNPPASSVASQSIPAGVPPAIAATLPPEAVTAPTAENSRVADLKAGLAQKQAVLKPSPQSRHGAVIAGNMSNNLSVASSMAGPVPPAALAYDAPKGANETVEVTGASPVLTADTSISSDKHFSDKQGLTVDEAPVLRAKPALEGAANEAAKMPFNGRNVFALNGVAKQAAAIGKSANWMITAGTLQRSLDGGQSWQTALSPEHPLACYAIRGQEVWAGGQAGTLMRSTDGGATWNTVVASPEGQALGSDITHIELRGSNEIFLTTSNHESWDSSDGGKSWARSN
jgi:hypothetical protein